MKLANGLLALALIGAAAHAQEKPRGVAAESTSLRDHLPVQTFYLTNAAAPNDANEILTGLRLILPPQIKLYLTPAQNAITIVGPQEELETAQKLIAALDRPKKSFRLTFTITESDGGKRIGVQHSSVVVAAGQRTTLKNGSKVPVATGSNGSQTQFTYLDVGINIDVTLNEVTGGAQLKAKVEQSSIGEDKEMLGVHEPVVRQSVIEGVSILQTGKPEVIGALDISGSTRHLEVEVVMEPVK